MKETFTQYIERMHMEDEPTVLDDDLPEAYDEWLTELTKAKLNHYAADYADLLVENFIKTEGLEFDEPAFMSDTSEALNNLSSVNN